MLGVGPASSSSAAAAPLVPLESATAMPASGAIAAAGNVLPQMELNDNQLIGVIKREIQDAQNEEFRAKRKPLSIAGEVIGVAGRAYERKRKPVRIPEPVDDYAFAS